MVFKTFILNAGYRVMILHKVWNLFQALPQGNEYNDYNKTRSFYNNAH